MKEKQNNSTINFQIDKHSKELFAELMKKKDLTISQALRMYIKEYNKENVNKSLFNDV
jgi:antitoxin component of RelBE/YafQ-DinJ toxin-antitoxin module